MKKIALSLILGLCLVACKKDDHKMLPPVAGQDSLQVEKPDSTDVDHVKMIELKPEQMALELKNKANDTLYITNFFATWCGPCMKEIPHFKEKLDELQGQPVKFTFVSLDNKTDWETSVSDFADEYNIRKNIVLLDGTLLDGKFFQENFKTWKGEAIPFTLMKKGELTDEYMGLMTKELLNDKVAKMQSVNVAVKANNQKEKNKITGPAKASL